MKNIDHVVKIDKNKMQKTNCQTSKFMAIRCERMV